MKTINKHYPPPLKRRGFVFLWYHLFYKGEKK
nr:MAG TPA: hypothetical protein [Caudoviricetes sp.]